MGLIHQNISDDILQEFNDEARRKFGDKKGCKRMALVEAIQNWTRSQKTPRKAKK